MSQVSYGTITIVDTTDIGRIYMVYAKSVSNTTPPSDELTWSESIASAPGEGDFIWQKTVVEKAITEEKTYSDPVCVTGSSGQGVEKIINYYCNYGQGQPEEDYSGWQLEIPEYDESKPNYWTKVVVIYGDDTREDFQASGTIATFESEKIGTLDSLEVSLSPIQSGSGTPSPSNVRPISGWDEVETNVTGVNVWDEEWELGNIYESTGGNGNANDRIRSKNYIPILPNATYYVKGSAKPFYYDADKNYLGFQSTKTDTTFVTLENAHFMRFIRGGTATYNNDISINYPSTDHDYHAYQGHTYTADLGQTVYGGTLDVVSGVLTVDRAMIEPTSVASVAYSQSVSLYYCTIRLTDVAPSDNVAHLISNRFATQSVVAVGKCYVTSVGQLIVAVLPDQTVTTKAQADAWFVDNPTQFCYDLATPTTIQCDPQTVQTLIGDNNVWGDGSVEVRGHTISKRDVMIYKDGGLTDVVNKSAEANTNAAEALERVKKIWSNSTGSYMASGIGTNEVDIDDSSTYGFNSKSTTTGVSFNYNTIPLTSLGTDGIKLYSPTLTNGVITGSRLDATLDTNGLVLNKGGIKASEGTSNFIYLSTDPYGNYSINGSTGISDWKQIIGTKFGVRADGTLYASNANIQGILTAGAGSTIGPWSITATSIYKGSATHGAAGSGNMYFGDNGLSISNTFKVSSAGVLNATGAQISGNLAATDGFTVAQNNKTLTSITTNGMIVYDGNGSNDSNIVAKFTSNGAQIGKNVNTFTEINPSAIVFKNGSATLLTIDQNSFNATVGGKSEAFKVSYAENKPEKASYSFNCDDNNPLSIELDIPTDRVFSISINFKIDGYSDSNVFNLKRSDFQLIPPSSTSESYTPGGIYPGSWAVRYESRRGWNGEQLPTCDVSAVYEYDFNDHILTITPSSTNVTISNYDVVISWQESDDNNYDEVYLILGNRSSVGSNGLFSSSFGQNLIASGNYSFAQGDSCVASGTAAHAYGRATIASGECSHAEGVATKAGFGAHAEGNNTQAGYASGLSLNGQLGKYSHAEGKDTFTRGDYSHVQNLGTYSVWRAETVVGKYNSKLHPENSDDMPWRYSFVIGNGSDDDNRSNALTVDWDGNVQSYSQIADSSKTSYDAYNYSHNYAIIDKTGDTIGAVGNHIYANGAIGSFLTAGRTISGTKKWNSISVNIDNSGNYFYGITDPRAFCSALDLGELLSHEPAAITCTTGKYMQLAYFTVTPGTWLLMGSGQFPYVNTTGIRRIYMSTATSGYNNVTTAPASLAMQLYNNVAPISGNIPTYVNSGPMPITFTSNTIVRLIGFQNSGSNISVTGRIYAVRLA